MGVLWYNAGGNRTKPMAWEWRPLPTITFRCRRSNDIGMAYSCSIQARTEMTAQVVGMSYRKCHLRNFKA